MSIQKLHGIRLVKVLYMRGSQVDSQNKLKLLALHTFLAELAGHHCQQTE